MTMNQMSRISSTPMQLNSHTHVRADNMHTHAHAHQLIHNWRAQMYVNVVHIQGYIDWNAIFQARWNSIICMIPLYDCVCVWVCVRSGQLPIVEVIIISMPLQPVARDQTNPKHLFILFISLCMCYSSNSCNYLQFSYVWTKFIGTC